MAEPRGPGAHRSIFVRLLAVMVSLALLVPLLVIGAFVAVLRPELDRTLAGPLAASAELLAKAPLAPEAARALAARHDLGLRHDGPGVAWATEPGLPPPSAAGPDGHCGAGCQVARGPDGGTYVLVSHPLRRAQRLHDRFVLGLALALVGAVVAAHEILRRSLAPLRALRRGVAALSAGDLEVVVPLRGDDELSALAQAFNRMVERVRGMVRARDQLLLDVSHELRSPLTRMRVALALWEEGEPRRRLERNLAEMEALVTRLLELERLRAGRGLERARHDLVEIVRDAVLAFADRPPGVALGALPPAHTAEVDPDQVRSALNNLLENALRHALPDSAPVRVSLAALPDGGAEVRVEDDGPGFPPEDLPRLFEPFFRVDRSRSRRTGGYGLGLALVRRILEAHGGTVEARNRPGRGAELVLRFPASEAPGGPGPGVRGG